MLPEWSCLWLCVTVYLAPDRPLQMSGSKLCSILTLQSCCDCTLGSVFGGWVCHGSLPLSVSLFWFCWAYVAVKTDIFQQGASSVRNTCVLCPWIVRERLWWNICNHVNLLFQTLSVSQKLYSFYSLKVSVWMVQVGKWLCFRFSVNSVFLTPVFLRLMQCSLCVMAGVPVL